MSFKIFTLIISAFRRFKNTFTFETSEVGLTDVITSNQTCLLIIQMVAKGNNFVCLVSSGWGEIDATWYVGHYLACWTNPG
jgi:hypothetical protein